MPVQNHTQVQERRHNCIPANFRQIVDILGNRCRQHWSFEEQSARDSVDSIAAAVVGSIAAAVDNTVVVAPSLEAARRFPGFDYLEG